MNLGFKTTPHRIWKALSISVFVPKAPATVPWTDENGKELKSWDYNINAPYSDITIVAGKGDSQRRFNLNRIVLHRNGGMFFKAIMRDPLEEGLKSLTF